MTSDSKISKMRFKTTISFHPGVWASVMKRIWDGKTIERMFILEKLGKFHGAPVGPLLLPKIADARTPESSEY